MTDESTSPTRYAIDAEILQRVGPRAAMVHAILAANDDGDGASMTHRQVAKAAGITHITARRAIHKLCDAGLLTSATQVRDNWQQGNLYQVQPLASPAQCEQTPAHIEQPSTSTPPSTPSEEVLSESSSEEDLCVTPEEKNDGVLPSSPSEALRATWAVSRIQGEPQAVQAEESAWEPWVPSGTPMPTSTGKINLLTRWDVNLLRRYQLGFWLVMHFEDLVLDQENRQRQLQGKKPRASVGESRRMGFHRSAVSLLECHPLAEVVEVIDWLFTECSGYLPFPVENEYTGRSSWQDRKVTNLRKILDHYEEITSSRADEQIHPLEAIADVPRGSGINFGKPFDDAEMESKVADLVGLFGEFRRSVTGDAEFHEARTRRWAKSFRIMLASYHHPFEDIERVIVTLTKYRTQMDVQRYPDPYDLHRNGEWVHVMAAVEAQEVIQQAEAERLCADDWESRPIPPTAMSKALDHGDRGLFDDDTHGNVPYTNDDSRRASGMGNVEERRARYAARAAKSLDQRDKGG